LGSPVGLFADKFLILLLERFWFLLHSEISSQMLMPDLLPIRITYKDDLVDNIKQVLKFSNSELETPFAFFCHGVRWQRESGDREKRLV